MLKKIFILTLFIFSLSSFGDFSYAANPSPGAPGAAADYIDSSSFMFDLSSVTHDDIENTTKQGWMRRGINYFFERIIGFLAAVIGSLSVLMMAAGGFLMLSSAGNEQQYEKGKNYAKYAIIGLIFVLTAYILVTLVQLLISSIYA